MILLLACLKFLLLSAGQAVDPLEGDLPRYRCIEERTSLQGCTTTLLEEYKRTDLPQMIKPDSNINDADTWFMLLTRKNRTTAEYLDKCGGSVPTNSFYNCEQETIVIIHGYAESPCQVAWCREIKDQYLLRGDYNIIIVDYAWGNQLDYYRAIQNAYTVGKQTALLLMNLTNKTCTTAGKITVIGHSLGAQIAATACLVVNNKTGEKCGRIIALDPAGPGFIDLPLDQRLDKNDATCVLALHTNAGRCLPFFGYPYPVGHSDFFANGGSVQESCYLYTVQSFLKGDFLYTAFSLIPTMCYHKQSVQYFKVTIKRCACQIIGVQCDSWDDFKSKKCRSCGADGKNCEILGPEWTCGASRNGSRLFFFETTLVCPYCNNTGIDHTNVPEPDSTQCSKNDA